MPVVIAPAVSLPVHQVTTDEVLERIAQMYPDHPQLDRVFDVIGATTVRTRWYTRPLAEQFGNHGTLAERTREHLRDCLDLAERAARASLREAGLAPEQITALVVTSATGHSMPGLDVKLVERLGLSPSIRRIPVTQMACGGGSFAISMAAELVVARPEAKVLVVCADVFSHYLHEGDTGMDGMIFKALLGDAAGACVVRDRSNGRHMEIVNSFNCMDVTACDVVGTYVDNDGLHTRNSPKLMGVIRGLLPGLREWLEHNAPADSDGKPEFIVSHTGSPRVLECFIEGLECAPELFDPARDSLSELGNLGSVSLLDGLERTFAKPPESGAHGVILGIGPGIFITAVKAIWWDEV
ncbi:PhlD [Streptomyces sp. NBC_00287]|uniref:PhlD n=1 Tax=Streptomyces sp. NBC_00287 TaxID=2975702 RepID=UPI002E2D2D23|nr:PhlD [Streptomyces sp. NBC_00287]